MRRLLVLASLVAVSACSLSPQLSPRALGCYRVQLDSFPAEFERTQVPRPPSLVRLDTIDGGQVDAPVSWVEQQGRAIHSARLSLMSPGWRIEGDRVWVVREGPNRLPADSIVLRFSNDVGGLFVLLGANGDRNWEGWAFSEESATQTGKPLVPTRLLRSDCGNEPLVRTRLSLP